MDDLLGTAQVWFCLIADQFALYDERTREIARYLEDSDGPFFHISSDANTNARFKVGIELIALYHIKRYGAVGKQHLACFWVDGGRISLETADAKQRLDDFHGEHRWDITLATCHDTLGIEFGQSQTTCVVNTRQQIESSDSEALYLMPLDDRFQGVVYLIRNEQGVSDGIC